MHPAVFALTTNFQTLPITHNLTFCDHMRVWDMYCHADWLHLLNLAVYYVLSTLLKLPWLWSQRRSKHVCNYYYVTTHSSYVCTCWLHYTSLNSYTILRHTCPVLSEAMHGVLAAHLQQKQALSHCMWDITFTRTLTVSCVSADIRQSEYLLMENISVVHHATDSCLTRRYLRKIWGGSIWFPFK